MSTMGVTLPAAFEDLASGRGSESSAEWPELYKPYSFATTFVPVQSRGTADYSYGTRDIVREGVRAFARIAPF
jgi:hypothetical protein